MVFTGMGIANSIDVTTTDINKYKLLKETQLSNSSLIDTVQNLVAKTICQTIVTNKTSVTSIIKLHNSINFVAGKRCPPMSGGFVLRDIEQTINIDSTIQSDKQTIIANDIMVKVNNNITQNIKNITSDTDTNTNKQKIGSTFGGIVDGAIGVLSNMADTASKTFSDYGNCVGIANSCDTNTTNIIDKELQDKFKLDTSFSLSETINTDNLSSFEVKTEDVAAIMSEISSSNDLLVKNVCPKFINVTDIEQKLDMKTLMQNNTITSLASKIATNYINQIDKIMENINSHATTTINDTNKGDIAALGDATAAIINSGGKALSGAIDSTGNAVGGIVDTTGDKGSKAIETVGDAASGGLEKIGGAVGGVFGSFTTPLIIIAVIIAVGLIGYFFILPMLKKKKTTKSSKLVLTETSQDMGNSRGNSMGNSMSDSMGNSMSDSMSDSIGADGQSEINYKYLFRI